MSDLPTYDLELKAASDRQRLHESVEQLRFEIRDKLDVNKMARQHLALGCGIATVLGMTAGYLITGIFVGR
jgi:hypothetical protein